MRREQHSQRVGFGQFGRQSVGSGQSGSRSNDNRTSMPSLCKVPASSFGSILVRAATTTNLSDVPAVLFVGKARDNAMFRCRNSSRTAGVTTACGPTTTRRIPPNRSPMSSIVTSRVDNTNSPVHDGVFVR